MRQIYFWGILPGIGGSLEQRDRILQFTKEGTEYVYPDELNSVQPTFVLSETDAVALYEALGYSLQRPTMERSELREDFLRENERVDKMLETLLRVLEE